MAPIGWAVANAVLRALRKCGIVAFLIDHKTLDHEAYSLSFLGDMANVNMGPALLAIRAEALIWPIYLERLENEQFMLHLQEPLDTKTLTGSNEDKIKRDATVRINLYNPEGQLLETVDKNLKINNGSQRNVTHRFDYILNPKLWSPDSPALYRVETQLIDKKGNIIDRRIVDTGIRTFGFDENGRFILNGEPLKLRGICRHQDMKPLGPALSDEMHRRDMIKEKCNC